MLVICSVIETLLTLDTNSYGTTFDGMPGSFDSVDINACVVGIGVLKPRFIVSSEGLELHKRLDVNIADENIANFMLIHF